MRDLHLLGLDVFEWEQGFLAADGTFLTREQARDRAIITGQCLNPSDIDMLFSEDLW